MPNIPTPNNAAPTPNNGGVSPKKPATVTKTTTVTKKTGLNKTGVNPKILMAIGGFILSLIIIAIIAVILGSNNKKQQMAAQERAARQAQMAAASAAAAEKAAVPSYFGEIPDNHWAKQPQPLEALSNMITEEQMTRSAFVTPEGLTTPRGGVVKNGTPEYMRMGTTVKMQILDGLNRSYQVRPTSSGASEIYAINPQNGQYSPIEDAVALKQVEDNARTTGGNALSNEVNSYTAPVVAASAPAPAPIPQSVITQQEKDRYLRVIELQKQENEDIRRENNRLAEDLKEQRKSVVTIFQKLENSPSANNALRATMLPKETGLKVEAIVGDRVWLKDKQGKLHTMAVGEVIPSTNLRISDVDENSGFVFVVSNK